MEDLKYFDIDQFAFPHVPENASGEVILGSLYRALNLAPIKENNVGNEAREFKKRIKKGYAKNGLSSPSGLTDDIFTYIIENLIESPRARNQNRKDVFYLSPLIPELAIYGSVARYVGNPWNPGDYIIQMIYRGESSKDEADKLVEQLRLALKVNPPNQDQEYKDDVWSFFLHKEFEVWRNQSLPNTEEKPRQRQFDQIKFDANYLIPSRIFTRDIKTILSIKPKLTRKRWVALLEAYLRISITIDVLWLCFVQNELIQILKRIFKGSYSISRSSIQEHLSSYRFFYITSKVQPVVNESISSYVKASLILRAIKDDINSRGYAKPISLDPNDILNFINGITELLTEDEFLSHTERVNRYLDSNIKILYGGISSRSKNLKEFLSYVPARRNSADPIKSSYDQGYWYKKANNNRNSPWVFMPGPASLTILLQCCCASLSSDNISVGDFIQFLSNYGIVTNEEELSNGTTGKILRSLGYILDSPDAEGGIMITKPY